ncbi:MAG: hypothetical protein RMJ33_12120 [Saprospiraceae bacterium]|nr:hypothetical protein [Saprospiraceae bacterium]MDW8230573.1 hypothetical protein [Saprospiraceae bacterium]
MTQKFLWAVFLLSALYSCEPPTRLRVVDKNTPRDSVHYVGIAEEKSDIDLRKAQLLGTVKIGDRGATLDCHYADVLERACRNAGRIGGNLLVVTQHRRNQVKSNCHVLKAEIYAVSSLEGMESRMYWHPERRLRKGDLRGAPPETATGLPPLHTRLTCRLGGDFLREAFIRTETLFFPDSTYRPAEPRLAAIALRRAQLYFDLTEAQARLLKAQLVAIGPDLDRLVGEYRARTEEHVRQLRADQTALDAELSATSDAEAVLSRWEDKVQKSLKETEAYAGQQRVDLRKRKRAQ